MLDGTQSNQGPLFTLTSKPSPCSLEETQHRFFARQRGFLRAWSPGLKPKAARTRLASFLCKGPNISYFRLCRMGPAGPAHLCCYRTGAAVDSSLWGVGGPCVQVLYLQHLALDTCGFLRRSCCPVSCTSGSAHSIQVKGQRGGSRLGHR